MAFTCALACVVALVMVGSEATFAVPAGAHGDSVANGMLRGGGRLVALQSVRSAETPARQVFAQALSRSLFGAAAIVAVLTCQRSVKRLAGPTDAAEQFALEIDEALLRVRSLEKSVTDLKDEVASGKQRNAVVEEEKASALRSRDEVLKAVQASGSEKADALAQVKAVQKALDDSKAEYTASMRKVEELERENAKSESRVQETQQARFSGESSNSEALSRVRALEKAILDAKKETADAKERTDRSSNEKERALKQFSGLTEALAASDTRGQSLAETLKAIGAAVSGALNDPENDPVALLQKATQELADTKAMLEEEKDGKEQALARMEALDLELGKAKVRAGELVTSLMARGEALEASELRAKRLAEMIKEIEGATGAGQDGFFGLFKAKKDDEESFAGILAQIDKMKQMK